MVWLSVDKDGTEKISDVLPLRRKGIKSAMWGFCKGRYTKNQSNKWCNGWSNDTNDFLPFDGMILPKDSIEKLIGRKLTWQDEPVEI